MKRYLFTVICLAIFAISTTNVSAQGKGDMAVGAGLAYGTGDSFSNIGLGAKFQWNPIEKLRIEPSFTYYFKKDYISMWDLSANAHYLFPVAEKFTLYPLAGVGILNAKVSVAGVSASDSEFGFNLGGGADFKLSDKLFLNAELKYKIGDAWNRFIISAGIGYKF